MNELESLDGVGPTIADHLRAAGFETVDDVEAASVEELAAVDMIGESTARAILGEDGGSRRGPEPTVDEHIDEICELAELPVSDRGVIRLSDIGWRTHQDWTSKEGEPYDRYQARWEKARGQAERKLAEEVALNDPRFLLERAFGYVKTEKREIESDNTHRIEGEGFVVEFGDK